MRNLAAAYRPVERRAAGADVFHTLDAAADGEWVTTSVNMRPDPRRRLKQYAASNDKRIQEVVDRALDAFLT